ncbi:MAG: hypothetical protein FJX77_12085, partial [Armatimonadetes bacterium]|nr:hypothetical protein [Armatimonadota bacterium]
MAPYPETHAILAQAEKELEWPAPEEILDPGGGAARFWLRQVRGKLGSVLQRLCPQAQPDLGVLVSADRENNAAELVAIVGIFRTSPDEAALRAILDAAWNFVRAPLCVVVDRQQVRAWSCWEQPSATAEKETPPLSVHSFSDPEAETAQLFHWMALATGQLLERYPERFQPERRADRLLLENLREVRSRFLEECPERPPLADSLIHRLLGRLVFAQYLFQRRDFAGEAVLKPETLRDLLGEAAPTPPPTDLEGVLRSKETAYRLFRWLADRLGGDTLEPDGAGDDAEAAWRAEMALVQDSHLTLLAEFVGGMLRLRDGQRLLWSAYALDAIPLDFLSRLYEEFVRPGS